MYIRFALLEYIVGFCVDNKPALKYELGLIIIIIINYFIIIIIIIK